jgi:UDP-N-acetylmuramoyl-L-alanyl-D-glutamate--2,6-diaminopimelate ligase
VSARLSQVAARLSGATLRGDDVDLDDAVHVGVDAFPGALFCAVPGRTHDGHDHASEAIAAGASALLVERWLDVDVPQVRVPSVRAAMGPAAATIHGDPSGELLMLGVTGTNGKTTVTFLLEAIVAGAGMGSGRIGTLGARLHGREEPGVRTTPEGTDLQRLLRSMRTRGADAVSMEVSSHGLDLHRVDGTVLDVAAFTNLTRDHLDWHGDMERYLAAKARLFTPHLSRHAVVLVDAPGSRDLLALVEVPVTTLGAGTGADVRIRDRAVGRDGSSATLVIDGEAVPVRTAMRGTHNLDNVLLAVTVAIRAGIDPEVAARSVAEVPAPPGRLEPVGEADDPLVLVDYAHTPDAIGIVVGVGRGLVPQDGRLIVVLGAGGDRDREKRAPMGEAAGAAADVVLVTDDNPRSEDPASIRAAIAQGARGGLAEVEVHAGRSEAIARAIGMATPEDVVLVLGRGHESHQEVAGRFLPLDDRELVRAALAGRRDLRVSREGEASSSGRGAGA